MREEAFRRALKGSLSGVRFDPARQRAVLADMKGEKPVRRKMTWVVALVTAMLLLGGTALAAGMGLNLFEYFGRTSKNWPDQSAQWAGLAEQSVLETEAPVFIAHETLGEAEATITNAYYDGWRVIAAFSIMDDHKIDRWTPTEEQKAELVPDPAPERVVSTDDFVGESQAAIRQEILAAVEAGQPVGYSIRLFYAGELTANGIPLLYDGGDRAIQDIGARYEIMEYITPLREEVRNQDELELRIPLTQAAAFFWFNGSDWYIHNEPPRDAGAMTATVRRSGRAEWDRRYEGVLTGSDGLLVGVEAYIEDGTLTVMMSADEPGLPFRWETKRVANYDTRHLVKSWSITGLYDENGEALPCFSSEQGEYGERNYLDYPNSETFLGHLRQYRFEGDAPEVIRVEIDGWDDDGQTASVLLTPAE